MSAKSAKPPTTSRSGIVGRRMDDELVREAAKRGRSYRGVKLQPLLVQPKTSRRRLQEAVEYAIVKNAAALTGSK